jgi:hypothetical protein
LIFQIASLCGMALILEIDHCPRCDYFEIFDTLFRYFVNYKFQEICHR